MKDRKLKSGMQPTHGFTLFGLISLAHAALSLADARPQPQPQPQIFIDTPVRVDPTRPWKIGPEFYPPESVKLREEGTCVVNMTVDKFGEVHDPKLVTSSGSERLDAACIAAASSGHLMPAYKNGAAIDSTTNMPIKWTLPKPSTLADCMATREREPSKRAGGSSRPIERPKSWHFG